ncbi:protein ALP1-like [Solenopsis invicta]|uniref:protein ALP1-like n=1 Tax=Solenopsis invicta TaxID=13686 RepID=UPI00193E8B1D|nr:protein ALP1-like [Solenopsis invicta]
MVGRDRRVVSLWGDDCDAVRRDKKVGHLKAREPISVKKQVAVGLYKIASCSEYRVVENVFGIHKSTVKKCMYRVVNAVNEVMTLAYINMPHQDEAKYIAMQFENVSHIPQIISCIDGTHLPITVPEESYRDFVNRKGWASYNVQAIVDHNGRFCNVFANHPGSVHDAVVFKVEKEINGQKIPFMIVGDPAYPFLPWLIKSYSGSVSHEEESFNVYLNSARVFVEMAFGRLKARWRMLQKKIDCHYKFVPQVIVACCVLHNFCEDNKDRFLEEWLQQIELNELTNVILSGPQTSKLGPDSAGDEQFSQKDCRCDGEWSPDPKYAGFHYGPFPTETCAPHEFKGRGSDSRRTRACKMPRNCDSDKE